MRTTLTVLACLAGIACAAGTSRAAEVRTGKAAFGDWHEDAPGMRRKITVQDLPAPYATRSSSNSPSFADRRAGAMPQVPEGFAVEQIARGLEDARLLRTAPNGDVFVAESSAGRIMVLRPTGAAGQPVRIETFASDLNAPFGIAFYPPGPDPQWVYVGNTDAVVRFPYRNGDTRAREPARTVVPDISDGSGHSTRDVAFSKDGQRMFVSVGSQSNVAQSMATKSPAELRQWKASHALGAAWGGETGRANVLVFDLDGSHGRVFAAGIRNCVGMAVQPASGNLWCAVNERDSLGDNLVPDYVTRVQGGAFYGWPWYYLGDHQDPRHAGERPDLAGKATVPDVLLQPHSAPLQMTFYDGTAFPPDYRGQAFVALHGSWNRSRRTGYKVVRVIIKDGKPTGAYEDFMTGLVANADAVWARPVGVTTAKDGSLWVSEDAGGTVWRVSWKGTS